MLNGRPDISVFALGEREPQQGRSDVVSRPQIWRSHVTGGGLQI
jgi:hypothetical protein